MPYINKKNRQRLEDGFGCENVGQLTYIFQQEINSYLLLHGLSYQTISEVKAALMGAYDDFQERVVKGYEEQKMKENGDVWSEELTGEGGAA